MLDVLPARGCLFICLFVCLLVSLLVCLLVYSLTIQVTAYCAEYYYGPQCQVFCLPVDDCSGHYVCNETTGDLICADGWTGENCTDLDTTDPDAPLCSDGNKNIK